MRSNFGEQLLIRRSKEQLMIKEEQLWLRLRRDVAELSRRRMRMSVVFLANRGDRSETSV